MSTATLTETAGQPGQAVATASLLFGDLADVMAANRAAAQAAVARATERPMTRAVIYARASADAERTGLTTGKQVVDGKTFAATRSVPVIDTYADNGKSAWKVGVRRHEFERLLRDAKAGLFDVVIVRHTDRLYRQLAELPRIIAELAPYARIIPIHEGEVDLSTADGILRAQMLGAVAEHESRVKAERLADHARHRAHNGRMVTGNRPFGWAWRNPCAADETCEHNQPHEPNARPVVGSRAGLVPHPEESIAVATAYEMLAGGSSLGAVARHLNDEGYRGTAGGNFRGETVRQIVAMPRQAGLVSHQDYGTDPDRQHGRRVGAQNVVAEAKDGQRIVDPELWRTVQRILADPSRRTTTGRPAGTVLSRIARCATCGGPLNASNRHYKRRDGSTRIVGCYLCVRGARALPGSEERHTLNRARAGVDALVLETVEQVILDNAERLRREAVTASSPVEVAAQAEVDRLREQLKGYHAVATTMEPADYAAAVNRVRAALSEAEGRAVTVAARPALARLLAADDVEVAWEALASAEDVEPVRLVLRELVESVQVSSGLPLESHVEIVWQPWVRRLVKAVA